jgi:hypothetical protein
MNVNHLRERFERRERVLVAAPVGGALAALTAELRNRGAEVLCAGDIEGATDASAGGLEAAYVAARDSLEATALLLGLLGARAAGARLMLVVPAQDASAYADLAALAEETMTFALSPARMADAAGIGMHRSAAYA